LLWRISGLLGWVVAALRGISWLLRGIARLLRRISRLLRRIARLLGWISRLLVISARLLRICRLLIISSLLTAELHAAPGAERAARRHGRGAVGAGSGQRRSAGIAKPLSGCIICTASGASYPLLHIVSITSRYCQSI